MCAYVTVVTSMVRDTYVKDKREVVRIHATQAYRETGVTNLYILSPAIGWR
jgi:hypothetical protein